MRFIYLVKTQPCDECAAIVAFTVWGKASAQDVAIDTTLRLSALIALAFVFRPARERYLKITTTVRGGNPIPKPQWPTATASR